MSIRRLYMSTLFRRRASVCWSCGHRICNATKKSMFCLCWWLLTLYMNRALAMSEFRRYFCRVLAVLEL